MKRVAIVQSSYIPWKGYFDLIAAVDEFILYDDAQFTKRDWRNRNRIKAPGGPIWLTVPVAVKGKYLQAIKDTMISDATWGERHLGAFRANYAKAPYWRQHKEWLEDLFLGCTAQSLSEINFRCITRICSALSIDTKLSWSMDYQLGDGRTERLVDLCRQAGATEYLSGPAARGYLDETLFSAVGITVRFADYSGYPEYPQLHPPFDHHVSIIDLLLNTGPDARSYMRG